MKKYLVTATVTLPTEIVIEAADKAEAFDLIKNIVRGEQLLKGCCSDVYIDVTVIDIKRIKKNGQG